MIWGGNPEYSAAPFLDARKNRASKKLMNRHESIEKNHTGAEETRERSEISFFSLVFFLIEF